MSKLILISLSIIILALLLTGGTQLLQTHFASLIPANDVNITYSGRVDFSKSKVVRFDWPGILISVNFEGSYIGASLTDGNNDYNIFIDGKQTGVLVTKAGIDKYKLAEKLSAGKHSLILSRRTEGYQGLAVFNGLFLDKGAKLLPPPERPKRKMEFIGDSITVGFGVEGPGITCPSEREFKNNWKAFSAVSARNLNAEYQIIAISGRGVVKNYGEKTNVSAEPLPIYYDRTLQNDANIKWNFKEWIPDVVVINLGTNDYSAQPIPDEKVFVKAYAELIVKVRSNYPVARIFCCVGPVESQELNNSIIKVFELIKDNNVYRVDMAKLTEEELGCDWHPNEAAAKRLAQELVDKVKPVMGW
ncbi:MAG: SGNH/GDSL hydrolase family protein [bacterium]